MLETSMPSVVEAFIYHLLKQALEMTGDGRVAEAAGVYLEAGKGRRTIVALESM